MVKLAISWANSGSLIRVLSMSIRIYRKSIPQGIEATTLLVTPFETECIKNHHYGTFAVWLLNEVKALLHLVSSGFAINTWHCSDRLMSYLMLARLISIKGTPANKIKIIATQIRFSTRIADSAPLLPSSAPSALALSHSCKMMQKVVQKAPRLHFKHLQNAVTNYPPH